jgi:hypothetical protein
MDSFELRMQFINSLMNLNSSKQASLDICNFLIRNYFAQEDLYPAILETLSKLDINKRLNIFQFIDDFLSLIMKDVKLRDNDIIFNYAFLIISDLQKILQFVIPGNPMFNNTLINKDEENGISNSETEKIRQLSQIRTLANLPFCFRILTHISELFNWEKLQFFKQQFMNDSLSELISEDDLSNSQNGILFNDSEFYSNNIEATKSSHVDDYVNSSPKVSDINNKEMKIEQELHPEEDYIPEKIKQGLYDAWSFIMNKRRQSIYESLLIDNNEDPFKCKQIDIEITESSNDQDNTCLQNTNDDMISTSKTPTKTPSKTPGKICVLPSSQPALEPQQEFNPLSSSENPQNILKLSHNLILQRIEADRERQKRGKETSWEIERKSNKITIDEFNYIYNTSGYNPSEDNLLIDEMENLYQLCTFTSKSSLAKAPSGPKPKTAISSPTPSANNKLPIHDPQDLFYNNSSRSKRPRINNPNTYRHSRNGNGKQERSYDDYYNNDDGDWYQYNNDLHKGGYRYRSER